MLSHHRIVSSRQLFTFNSQLTTFSKVCTIKNVICGGFPGGAVVENLPANAGDTGSSPGLGRSHMPRSD